LSNPDVPIEDRRKNTHQHQVSKQSGLNQGLGSESSGNRQDLKLTKKGTG